MSFDPRETIDRFVRTADTQFRDFVRVSIRPFRAILTDYETLLGRISDGDHTKNPEANEQIAAVEKLLEYLYDVKTWLGSIAGIRERISGESERNRFLESLESLLDDLPERTTLAIPEEFRKIAKGDPLHTVFGKIRLSAIIRLKRAFISIGNNLGKLVGKQLREQYQASRTFDTHNFIRRYMIMPAMEQYDSGEQALIKKISDHIGALHDSADRLYRSLTVTGVHHNHDTDDRDTDENTPGNGNKPVTLDEHQTIVQTLSAEADSFEEEICRTFTDLIHQSAQKTKENFESAGTFLLPGKKFDSDTTRAIEEKQKNRRSKSAGLWEIHLRGEEEDWLKDLHIVLLRLKAEQARIVTVNAITEKVRNTIITALNDTAAILNDALEKLSRTDDTDTDNFIRSVGEESTVLLHNLRESAIPRIMDAVLKANIENVYQQYIRDIQSSLDIFEGELVIFEKRDEVNVPPVSKVSRIMMKDIVQEEMLTPLLVKHAESLDDLHGRLEQSFRSISEIDQIVEYNVNAAIGLTEEPREESTGENKRALVIEGFERTSNQIKELTNGFERIIALSDGYLGDMTGHLSSRLQELADSDKVLEVKLRLARARTREQMRRTAALVWKRSAAAIRSIIPHLRCMYNNTLTWYRRVRKITGFEVIRPGLDTELTDYLIESRQRLERLPFVYQSLFSLKPLSDRRFFSMRNEEMNLLKNARDLWYSRKSLSVAVIGERGSGKTTFLNFAENDILSDNSIVKITVEHTISRETELLDLLRNAFALPDARSIEDIENEITGSAEQRVFICENIHNLFLRTVDGFEAIERFMLFIQRTQNMVLWIVTCALYGWRYLDLVIHISRYFTAKVELGSEERKEIEETILKRHRVSGYVLEFDVPEALKKNRTYRKLDNNEARQAYVRERFFDQLADLASGNIRVALLYWLTAIKEITKEKMIISPEIRFDHAFVYQLPAEELFTLAAIIQHESFTAEHHACVFHQDVIESRLILNRIESTGFLEKNGDQFSIHPFMYRPVVKALQSKNILQ